MSNAKIITKYDPNLRETTILLKRKVIPAFSKSLINRHIFFEPNILYGKNYLFFKNEIYSK